MLFFLKFDKIEKTEEEFSKINLTELSDPYVLSLFFLIKGLLKKASNNKFDLIESDLLLSLKKDVERKNKWLRLELFFLYLNTEMTYKAFNYLKEALQIDPKFYEAVLEECKQLDTEYNSLEIIKLLDQIPDSYADPDLKNILGVSHYNEGNIDDALTLLKDSIAIDSNSSNNYSLGFIYQDIGEVELAKVYLTNSIDIDNDNCDAINAYAWLLFEENNDFDRAEELFLKNLKLNKDQTIYDQIILFYLLTNNLENAQNYINESRKINDENFSNDGYEILLLMMSHLEFKNKLKQYQKKYYDFEMSWLEETRRKIIHFSNKQ